MLLFANEFIPPLLLVMLVEVPQRAGRDRCSYINSGQTMSWLREVRSAVLTSMNLAVGGSVTEIYNTC